MSHVNQANDIHDNESDVFLPTIDQSPPQSYVTRDQSGASCPTSDQSAAPFIISTSILDTPPTATTAADDDPTFCLSQSSSAYTVNSQCGILKNQDTRDKQTRGKMLKKQRQERKEQREQEKRQQRDQIRMKTLEEESAVRDALCSAGINPDDVERDCGLGSCRPRALHGCANIKVFIFTLCVFSTMSGMMIPGYLNSVITTIEKRFQIGSSVSGIIAASVEFGSLVAVIFVSYFGGNRHIPKWIGSGAILKGIGSLMFIIPHLATEQYSQSDDARRWNSTEDNICRTPSGGYRNMNCVDDRSGNVVLVAVLIVAQILVGTGGSPLYTLGTTYVDNHVSKEKSPAYLSFIYATSALGPVCGFALGALMLQFYVDFTTVDPQDLGITPSDPRWVGAWWLGFVIGGIMLLIMAIPLFAFPKVMHAEQARLQLELKQNSNASTSASTTGSVRHKPPTATDTLISSAATSAAASSTGAGAQGVVPGSRGGSCSTTGGLAGSCTGSSVAGAGARSSSVVSTGRRESHRPQQSDAEGEYGRRLQDIPSAIYNLISNPIYLVTCFGICCEIIIVSGFIVFLPKFLETQFGMTKSVANLLTGGIAIPAAVFGIMVGGYVLKRFHIAPRGAVKMMLALNLLGILGFSLLIFLGCDNVKMAGATLPYFNSSGHEILEANLTSPCNMDCSCSHNALEPVCGINGITYFSACHAGCTQMYASQEMTRLQNYSDCACILGTQNLGQEVLFSPMATSGPCKVSCQTLLPFMVLLFVMTFLVAGTHMPLLMLTLRSVKQEERAFALGMQFVILRLFAYIPAPIMFGNTIDSTCLLWKETCGQLGGCLMYDIVMFRFKYIGISAGLKLLASIFFMALYYLIKQQDMQDFKRPMMIGDLVKSVTSLASGVDMESALSRHSYHSGAAGTLHQRKGHRRSRSQGCPPVMHDIDISASIYQTGPARWSPGPPGTNQAPARSALIGGAIASSANPGLKEGGGGTRAPRALSFGATPQYAATRSVSRSLGAMQFDSNYNSGKSGAERGAGESAL